MNNSICTLFDNILIDIHKFKSLQQYKKHESDFTSFTQDLIHTKSITKRVIRKIFRTLGYNQLPI